MNDFDFSSLKLPGVNFLWPEFLWLMLLLPVLVLWYLWLLKRRRKAAAAYSSLSVVKQALQGQAAWRRHVPPALFLLSLAAMLFAASRPMAVITLPSNQKTIILALDVSGSMRATDIQPTRFVAMQQAAKKFLTDVPREVKVGIVAFAGAATVAQYPTVNREDLVQAIDRFQMQRGTATGNAVVISLATLFPDAGITLEQMGQPRPIGRALNEPPKEKKEHTPVPPGSYNSAAVIMLTDGQRTTGVDPMEAAKMAADRGVRVYTVGIGTKDGETIGFEGWSMRVRLDEETLKAVASRTAADYFYAGDANALQAVYTKLSSRISTETKETEISGLLALLAAMLAVISASLSVLWFNRIA
jgi:Ca-activated chloride channel homolog